MDLLAPAYSNHRGRMVFSELMNIGCDSSHPYQGESLYRFSEKDPGTDWENGNVSKSDTTNVGTTKEHILVVDDDVLITEITRILLVRLGYSVTLMNNSTEALKLFLSNPYGFELVVTDLNMPHLSGGRLIKEMLASRSDLPIILCTGFRSMLPPEEAYKIGVSAFIDKPIDMDELAVTVKKVLEKRDD